MSLRGGVFAQGPIDRQGAQPREVSGASSCGVASGSPEWLADVGMHTAPCPALGEQQGDTFICLQSCHGVLSDMRVLGGAGDHTELGTVGTTERALF